MWPEEGTTSLLRRASPEVGKVSVSLVGVTPTPPLSLPTAAVRL